MLQELLISNSKISGLFLSGFMRFPFGEWSNFRKFFVFAALMIERAENVFSWISGGIPGTGVLLNMFSVSLFPNEIIMLRESMRGFGGINGKFVY